MSAFLRWCSRCDTNFTRTNWQMHGHNPAQINCTSRDCRRKAVGYSGTEYTPTPLCGEHLMDARRGGNAVTFVDGRVCRLCDGHGRISAQERRDDSPGGQWLRCPECFGTGYDTSLRPPSSSQGRQTSEGTLRRQPGRPESPSERREREAQEQAARSDWFEREVAPLADSFPGRVPSGTGSRRAGQPPSIPPTTPSRHQASRDRAGSPVVPPLAPGSSAEDIRRFERSKQATRRRRTSRWKQRVRFLAFAGAATLTGAIVGLLFVFPILPDSLTETVLDIQQRIIEMIGE